MVVLDANILLEMIEERAHIEGVMKALADYQGDSLCTSTLSVSHAFYMAEAHHFDMSEVERVVARCSYIDVLAIDVEWALTHYEGDDFEDALQVAAAKRAGASTFLTLDEPLAEKYQKFLPIKLVR